ncbi:RhtB (resistance to homoserine/threonine) family protein [Rhizobium leguminosarum]|uniref:RhtB (Resistance to homoserine/threonine) family protein n=1 Tax=Rhizobium leguminosarum TaxID=384 RepID=A0AAE2SXH4_RHILE|nr:MULTISPECIES: LysE family transporter [Rhizobium]MBB4291851.1 RhtB (resistance to homoserine/threonine) family protein [Rhizobium leguminosarum]MBB4298452.1 RhtB (resistance to homoserine/threonine) family protein [Rhizobium leguminosarum]MBB4309590.1 RhtB (resistance to homoserine/threonine) family protein [Rhizobium leguminosarum]MBB4419027.1 RhtB (resistance to homoserine/threonine) family protein [Rhizobium leguminosarum]MBB4433642.1 RhtB (resistance to homoserine/threonine) family prot
MQYILEFLGLMAVFSIFIVVPGADFAVILRQSIVHGRRAAVMTGLGMGFSLLFHISYTILGLGLIVSKSLMLFAMIKWAGVTYLVYLGIKSFREPGFKVRDIEVTAEDREPVSMLKCLGMGFITNALNPKPVLFFLSLFSTLVHHDTPALIQFSYGIGMATALVAWFAGVSYFFTVKTIRDRFIASGKWFNRVTGAALVGFGFRLALSRAAD